MNNLNDLAAMLEQTAIALRNAQRALESAPCSVAKDDILSKSVRDVPGWEQLSPRARKAIRYFYIWENGKKFLWPDRYPLMLELVAQTSVAFTELGNVGMVTVVEIQNWLGNFNLKLKDEPQ